MEKRMLDVYAHYNIPAQTPYWRVASNARAGRDQWKGRLSANDQSRFDSYFSRWQEYRQRNDRGQVASMEKRMKDVYAHNHIPSNTRFLSRPKLITPFFPRKSGISKSSHSPRPTSITVSPVINSQDGRKRHSEVSCLLEDSMKRIFGILAVLIGMMLPALAQRMTTDD